MGTKKSQKSVFVIKYIRNSLILIVYRIAWKCNEFNEAMCKKLVWNVVQNTQKTSQIFVVISIKMYYT